jgi:CheY-like chemotaxis protein
MRQYLIVDDNVPFAENLAEILRDTGADVTVASSGADALGFIAKQRFDVMVTDMRMPGMNGAELVNQVRRIDPGLAAVVVTAFTGSEELEYAEHAGLVATLPKPVPIAQLMHLLELAHREGIVAIVEDDQSLSDNLAEVLRDRGFSPVTAASVLNDRH